jgi:hypothetical protein
VGVSKDWAIKFDRGHENNGRGYQVAKEEKALRGPIPHEDLCPEAKRGLEDFEFFRRFYLGHISLPWHVEHAEVLLQLLATPHKEFVVANGPPGVGKTTLLHDIACWMTIRDRAVRGLIGSRKAINAERMLRRIRRSLERPTPYRAPTEDIARGLAVDAVASLAQHYGRFKPENGEIWRSTEFTVEQIGKELSEEKEPTWSSYGVDSGVLSNRFGVVFWDDLVDRTNTRTVEAAQTLSDLWDSELETRLEPEGLLVLEGQRLSAHDQYARCRAKAIDIEEDDEEAGTTSSGLMYHRITYQAHDEERCDNLHKKSEAKAWPEGCLLDPYRLPWRDLSRIRSINRATYEITYQQRDVDPDSVLVPKVWIDGGLGLDGVDHPGCWDKERGLCELPKGLSRPLVSYATADPSPTKFWSIQWWVYHPETEQRFLLDLIRQSMDAPDFLDWNYNENCFYGVMEEWQQRSAEMGIPISHWIVEANAAQRFILQYDYVKRWKGLRSVEVIPHQTHRNKADAERGIDVLKPHYQFGRVRLPGRGDARLASLKLIDEVTRWPNGRSDDCVMAQWFGEYNLPNITSPDPSDIPLLERPSWMQANKLVGAA